jgi:hypothetical protein
MNDSAQSVVESALDTVAETGKVPVFEKMEFTVTRREPLTDCVSDLYAALHVMNMERNIET